MSIKLLTAAMALTFLTGTALAEPMLPPPGMMGPGPGHGLRHFLHDFDFDRDGKVTRAEFDRGSAERFKRIDKNNDGVITREELEAMRPPPEIHAGDGPPPPPPGE
jgi:hypothetical protein